MAMAAVATSSNNPERITTGYAVEATSSNNTDAMAAVATSSSNLDSSSSDMLPRLAPQTKLMPSHGDGCRGYLLKQTWIHVCTPRP